MIDVAGLIFVIIFSFTLDYII